MLPNCDDSPTRELWLQHGWQTCQLAEHSLYDLLFDPGEICNLASDSARAPILAEMRSRLDTWMVATNDPLLAGALSPPCGAILNEPDARSASDRKQVVI